MDSRQRRRRLWAALLIFALLLAGWVLLALQLSAASAGPLGFPFKLRSSLGADYGSDPGGGSILSLRFSIIPDFLRDIGLPLKEAESRGRGLVDDLKDPVPTATARNFEGDPPFTPTSTATAVPSDTLLPSPTHTGIPPSKTPVPTKTPKLPGPTAGPSDVAAPSITGGSLVPSPGPLGACTATVTISDLHVMDPAPSSGIAWVKLKYKILGSGSKGYQYSPDLGPPVVGGWVAGPGSAWDAYYNGSITIDFDSGYAFGGVGGKPLAQMIFLVATDTPTPLPPTETPLPPTETPTPVPPTATATPDFDVELWAIVQDVAGHTSYIWLADYTLPGSCAD